MGQIKTVTINNILQMGATEVTEEVLIHLQEETRKNHIHPQSQRVLVTLTTIRNHLCNNSLIGMSLFTKEDRNNHSSNSHFTTALNQVKNTKAAIIK
jgi:hypothetical protein